MDPGLPRTTGLVHICKKLNWLKPLEEPSMETSLWHCLSTLDLIFLGVGGMVGSDLYMLSGTMVKEIVGPAVLVSFGMAAMSSLLAAQCYAEFGPPAPHGLCLCVHLDELWAFGWTVFLEYLISGAVAHAWSRYLDSMFSHHICNFTEASTYSHVGVWQVSFLSHYPDFLAAGIILLASTLVSFQAMSSWLNHSLSGVLAHPHNWSPEEGGFAPFGFFGILAGVATCFFAFVGFDVIAPIAIAISLGLVATAYIFISIVLTLMVPWHSLDPDSILANAFYRWAYSWAGFIVVAASSFIMNTVLPLNLLSGPQIIYAMAIDRLFSQAFAHVHPQTQVPMVGMLVFGVLIAFMALLLDLKVLVQFLSIVTLLVYTFVATTIIEFCFQKALQSSSLGQGSPGPVVKKYNFFQDHTQLVGTDSAPEPQQQPALKPYLGFLGGCSHGVAGWVVGVMVALAITLGCVLVFEDLALHLPCWGHILLHLLSTIVFVPSLLVLGHQHQNQDTFQTPLVPLTPVLSTLLNICLMWRLNNLTCLHFFIFLINECGPGWGPGWLQDSREGKEDEGLGPAPQTCAIPAGLMVYSGFCIWCSKENQQEMQQPAAARSIVFPNGSLEETVQVMQPLSQALAQEPSFVGQPPVHEDSWRPTHPPPPSQEAGGPGSPL
ncbi:LOW QUALITY PROTEIN: cationic amino acid transporter 4 [Molossus nigricans]